jgi:putative flavoprotein involved in K+ transport
VFSPKDKIGDWLEMYTKVMELNYWTRPKPPPPPPPDDEGKGMDRQGQPRRQGGGPEAETTRPRDRHVRQVPNMPEVPRSGHLQGRTAAFQPAPRPRQAYKGKKVVVIGSNNSAHDICAALWETRCDVTMVQRSSTHIVKSDTLMDVGLLAGFTPKQRSRMASTTTRPT